MLSRRLRFGDGAGNLFRNGTYRLLMRDLERDKACAWQERAWAGALRAYLGHRTSQTVLYSLWRALAYHCDEAISAAHVYGCRIRSNGTGRAMRPRTRRHGRHYSSLCAIRGPCAWTARHPSASWRLWGKRNAIGSSPSVLVRSHTWTPRFLLATARQYRSRL